MTDKEATDILTKHVEGLKANPYVIVDECLYEAFSVALHALHLLPKIEVIADNAEKISTAFALQPCEDCVSREALKERFQWLDKATKYGNEDAEQQNFSYSTMMMYEIKDEIDNAIDSLPSVSPRRPTGKWILLEGDLKKCPVCGEHSLCPSKFCCSCGAELEV